MVEKASPQIAGIAIAGATASGKSALAMRLAEKLGGVVVNADSAQVYADLRVLTARPSLHDEARVPHALYGFVNGATSFSAAHWARTAAYFVKSAPQFPILAGGTGLYFRALFEGLAELPVIPTEIRQKWRRRAREITSVELYDELQKQDPVMAARLPSNDAQRITRALEVFDATGRSLAELQQQQTVPLINPQNWLRVVLDADRDALNERIVVRFSQMLKQGALDEVRQLLARKLDRASPVMKAIGVPELSAHLKGEASLDEAQENAIAATRRYAKRQDTWFRNQMPDWQRWSAADAEKHCLSL